MRFLIITLSLCFTLHPLIGQPSEKQPSSTNIYRLTFSNRGTHMHKVGSPDVNKVDADVQGTHAIAFSPCGTYLVTGTTRTPGRGSTRLYRVQPDSSLLLCAEADQDSGLLGTRSVAFSPCGNYIATGISCGPHPGTTRLYRVTRDPHPGQRMLSLVAFADGNETDPSTGQPLTWQTSSVAFSPCGNYLATGIVKSFNAPEGYSTKLYSIDLAHQHPDQRLVLLAFINQDAIATNTVAFSPCGIYLATGISRVRDVHGTTTRLYMLTKTPTLLVHVASFDHDSERQGTQTLAFSPNGDFLATGIDGRRLLHEIGTTRIYFVRPSWLAEGQRPHLVAHTDRDAQQTYVVVFNQKGNSIITGITDQRVQHKTTFYGFDPEEPDGPDRLSVRGKIEHQEKPTVTLSLADHDALFALGQDDSEL